MSFGSSSPAQLWSIGPATAELETNWGDPGAYVQGYFDAAIHLADEMARNRLGVDIVIYPALYLLRHGLELGFKALLRGYSYELDENFLAGRPHHSLGKLWQTLQPLLKEGQTSLHLDPGRASASVTLADIDTLVHVLDQVDPTGEAARFDTDLKGERTLKGISRVNLDAFKEICSLCGDWMLYTLDARQEVVSYVERCRRGSGAKDE